jgi:hypothetical protein
MNLFKVLHSNNGFQILDEKFQRILGGVVGIEFADALTFFSLETPYGWNNSYELRSKMNSVTANIEAQNFNAKVELSYKNSAQDLAFTAQLLNNTGMNLLDFVLRFQFDYQYIEEIKIGQHSIPADYANIYHQFDLPQKVQMRTTGGTLLTWTLETDAPFGFKGVVYVRSTHANWVFHVRVLPANEEGDNFIIKNCSKLGKTRPFNGVTQSMLNYLFGSKLNYRSERRSISRFAWFFFNPNRYPLRQINSDDKIKITAKIA